MYRTWGDFGRGIKWAAFFGAVLWTLIVLGIYSLASGHTLSGSALKGQSAISITIPEIQVPVQDLMWRELAITTRGPTLFLAYTYMPTIGFEWESKVSAKTTILGIEFDKDKTGLFDYRMTGQRFEFGYLAGYFAPIICAEQWGTSFIAQGEKDRKEISSRNWTLGGGCRVAYPIGRNLWATGMIGSTSGSMTKSTYGQAAVALFISRNLTAQFGYGFRHFRTFLDPITIEIRSQGPMAGVEVWW